MLAAGLVASDQLSSCGALLSYAVLPLCHCGMRTINGLLFPGVHGKQGPVGRCLYRPEVLLCRPG